MSRETQPTPSIEDSRFGNPQLRRISVVARTFSQVGRIVYFALVVFRDLPSYGSLLGISTSRMKLWLEYFSNISSPSRG